MDRQRNFLYAKMHAIIKELHLERAKPALLAGYGVEHTNQLSEADLKDLVKRLDEMQHDKIFAGSSDPEVRRWRSTLLSLLNKYGVYGTSDDWSHINRFLLDPRVCGKLIYQMTIEELKATCVRVRAILHDQCAKNEEIERLIIQN
jgi:hypothetical protein